ncbi:MAG: hypothetical protein ACFCUU_16160 [Cyclobacteriaceae bacterium]
MKKSYIIFFVLLTVIATALYLYAKYYQKNTQLWDLIPGNAIVVYESKNVVGAWNSVTSRDFWETAAMIPNFGEMTQSFTLLDSLSGKSGRLDQLTRNQSFMVSVHVTAADKFGFLFYLNLEGEDAKDILKEITSGFARNNNLTLKTRNYLGLEINEARNKNSKQVFSWFIHENLLTASFTPFLVEDVIRNTSNDFADNFASKVTSLNVVNKLSNDDGDIYINFKEISKLMSVFVDPFVAKQLSQVQHFAQNLYFDVKATDNEILFNGTSTLKERPERDYVSIFKNQSARPIELASLLPLRAAWLYHLTFSDFSTWQSSLSRFWADHDTTAFNRFMNFDADKELNFDWIDGEIGITRLESIDLANPDQLVFFRADDADKAFELLYGFTEKYNASLGDSLYAEEFGDRLIVQLNYPEFPATMLGNLFTGFENAYFTTFENYIVMGNSMQVVKRLFEDVENENTWGKSVRHNLFLENTMSEASLSVMVNLPRAWAFIIENLKPEWAAFFDKYENQFKSFDLMAFQVSNFDNRFYTSMALAHQKAIYHSPSLSRFAKIQSNYMMSPIITRPYIVRNHNNGRSEVLLQDKANILYLISNEGEVLWGDSIGSPLVSEIHQIDFYKNTKLQYLFATKNKIHLYDRNGRTVENFPILLPDNIELEHLSVIDYDNSKNYRFMAVDNKGEIYLYDKNKVNLEGWQPRKLSGQASVPGAHVRVRGGDCMIALQTNSVLNVMNRRGEMYPGFPVNLNAETPSQFFIEPGNNFETTRLSLVTQDGEIVQVNLKGKILLREQLYKPTKESKFWLVPDALSHTYVIVRQEYNKLSILDRKGKLTFEQNFLSSGDLYVQYYRLGTANDIFAVTDFIQEFTYLFDNSGELINFEPLESSFPIAMMYFSKNNDYQVYKNYQNGFSVMSFNK